MKRHQVSEELRTEINVVRERAVQLRNEVSSPYLKRRLDRALSHLDKIPELFDSEEYMRQALTIQSASIGEVVRIRDTFGADAEIVPSDDDIES